MEQNNIHDPPNRVTDLIGLKQRGASIECRTSFEILPVDFAHRKTPFQAFVFLCRWTGTVEGKAFTFRKCYARGCPHNLCPHVSQAIMIANRYLQRDYRRLELGGIEIEKKLLKAEQKNKIIEDKQEVYNRDLAKLNALMQVYIAKSNQLEAIRSN